VRLVERGRAVQARTRRTERAIERDWERHLRSEQMRALRAALLALREVTDPYT
jgi:hypothetical protein